MPGSAAMGAANAKAAAAATLNHPNIVSLHNADEAGGRIPAAPRVVSGRYLSLEQRLLIADAHLAGRGVRAIRRGGWEG